MKYKILIICIFILFISQLNAQIKLEGYFETQFGRTYTSDSFRWNMWDPNFYLESRISGSPVANTDFYFKFYSDKDNDYYKFTSFRPEAVFTEGHIDFRQEKNGNGFSTTLFTRESGRYWIDGSMLGLVNTGSVNNDGNGQGARFDFWDKYNSSATYVFSDFSQGSGDDVHLLRFRQSLLKNKLKTGIFFLRKNYATGGKNDYNQVIATDLKWQFGRYFLDTEFAGSSVPSEEDTNALNKIYQENGWKDFFKSNIATKAEFRGLRVGTANFGYWFFTPGISNYGNTYRNYMGDNKSNEFGFWLNSYYLVPKKAITITLNYSRFEKIIPDTIQSIAINDSNQFVYETQKIFDPSSNLYSEIYVEFVNGFKGKLSFNKKDEKWHGTKYKHYDFFSELSVENKLAKLLTQFKIKDIGESTEKHIAGVEVSVNLSEKWRIFTRGMIANDKVGSRHSIFGEIQYRLSGNTELFLQYGPSWWGQYGLVNDDGFASSGTMSKEVRLILKGWF